MTEININIHWEDTKTNLRTVLKKLWKSWKDFASFSEKIETSNIETDNIEKITVLIWGNQIWWSLSPFIHTYSSYIINDLFFYLLVNLEKHNLDLDEILSYIEENDNILWANVTMPYKIDVFEKLKELWQLDDSAKLVWAVNTISKINWKLFGFNTDMFGIINPLKEKLWENIKNITHWYVLWAWWAARAAVAALLKLGIKNIVIFNKFKSDMSDFSNYFEESRDYLKEKWNGNFNIESIEYDVLSDDKSMISKHITKEWILINTLPFWFKSELPKYPVKKTELEKIAGNIILYFDVVYDLNHEMTPMVGEIRRWIETKSQEKVTWGEIKYNDIEICDWIDMLVEQAKKWFELWTKWWNIDSKLIKDIIKQSWK